MNFKFEKIIFNSSFNFNKNLYGQGLVNFESVDFCRPSQVLEVLENTKHVYNININAVGLTTCVDHYAIAVSVGYNPNDWTGNTGNRSLFDCLCDTYVRDLRDKKAILIIDQSVEGYHETWLWKWFYEMCYKFKFPPSSIVYMSGALNTKLDHEQWTLKNKQSEKIKVIPSISLSYYIFRTYIDRDLDITFDKIINYKEKHNIELFDCTNLNKRPHRVLFYAKLIQTKFFEDGLISMPKLDRFDISHYDQEIFELTDKTVNKSIKLSPSLIEHKQNHQKEFVSYINRILDDVYDKTWLSIITESSYFHNENSVFLSEKTFKPIACMHPFIVVGAKHSLKYLRSLGFRTFEGFIDESYDNLEDNERMDAIIQSLHAVRKIQDKIAWYTSMRDVLEHNQTKLMSYHTEAQTEQQELVNYYKDYFNL